RRHDDLQQTFLSASLERGDVAIEHGLERLLRLPFGILWCHALDFVERKSELEIERLLAPQGAVIIEHGDALLGRHKIVSSLHRHPRDKIQDGLLPRAGVPGWQRVGIARLYRRALGDERRRKERGKHCPAG